MWRVVKIAVAVGSRPLTLLLLAASQAQFSFQHPKARNVKVLVSGGGAKLALNVQGPSPAGSAKVEPPKLGPRIWIQQTSHDFGHMDPLTRGNHSFVVKNNGDAPLLLDIASTTCQCTVAGLSDNKIPPGSEGHVELKWTVPGHGRVFRQLAHVRTNDPNHREISFTIEGLIRASIATDREELTVQLDPDKSTTTEVTVFSQRWDDFSIVSLDSGIEGLTWEEAPAEEAALEVLKAKSGRTLRLTIPGEVAATRTEQLRLAIEPHDADGQPVYVSNEEESCRLELPLHVAVRRRLSIYGPAIRSGGFIEAGETQQGVARQVRMQIKVRDREVSLPDLEFETNPSFLQASISPHTDQRTGDAVPGLYDFVVTIPSSAPACSYLGDVLGQVRIKTSHPRIPETPLGVRFAVLPR